MNHVLNKTVQAGFEYLTQAPLLDLLRQDMDIADATPIVSPKPMDVGRYDCVFGAMYMAQLVSMTLARAVDLDRTLGYEAAATGTSYLGTDPLAILGTPVASPLVTITAERSTPTGVATVKWDDEGVATQDFTMIKDGVLMNYPTTREQAPWLAPWAATHGQPVRSVGCARAASALSEPMQHTPNLILHPGAGSATEASLVAELEYGLHFPGAVQAGPATVDWQGRNIFMFPLFANVIRHGKVVGVIPGTTGGGTEAVRMALTINADHFWKHIQRLGGPASVEYTDGNGGIRTFLSAKGVEGLHSSWVDKSSVPV